MISSQAKDAFWNVVRDCLTELYGLSAKDAALRCKELRRKLEDAPPGWSGDMVYHDQPFSVASDLAKKNLELGDHREQYDRILARHNW